MLQANTKNLDYVPSLSHSTFSTPCLLLDGAFDGANMEEIWKDIPTKCGYEVSNVGNVRRKSSGKPIKLTTNSHGYKVVGIHGQQYRAHRLVLNAFVGPCPEGLQCAHLNGVRDDNRLENLKWVTPKENCFHKIAHGTNSINVGEDNPNCSIDNEDVVGIRWLYKKGFTLSDISRLLKINVKTVQKITSNKSRNKCSEPLKQGGESE